MTTRGPLPVAGVGGVQSMGDGAWRWRRDPARDPRALLHALRAAPGVIDAVVTEEYALVTFDPAAPPDAPWTLDAGDAPPHREGDLHIIQARYDGPDLDEVASRAGLTRDEAIRAHSALTYVARLVGFLPGFAYLGPVDPRIALPRRAAPRARVEAGSIGVAAGYTGVYPFASPGGWHVVGHAVGFTPFDAARGARIQLGDRVRFEPAP